VEQTIVFQAYTEAALVPAPDVCMSAASCDVPVRWT
jgi:hypothetical protein